MIFPRAHDLSQPGVQDRQAAGRGFPFARTESHESRGAERSIASSKGWRPQTRRAAQELSSRAVRRVAPEGDDRDFLAPNPKLLIADEPTTALDVTIQAQILELLKSLQKDMGMSVLLITHDFGVVSQIADRVAVMYAGKIVEEGRLEEIFEDPWHPYTKLLILSIPGIKVTRGGRLESIAGAVPNPLRFPEGCFALCPMPDICSQEPPPETVVGERRTVT